MGGVVGAVGLSAVTNPVAAFEDNGTPWSDFDKSYAQAKVAGTAVYDCVEASFAMKYIGWEGESDPDEITHRFVFSLTGHCYQGEKNQYYSPVHPVASRLGEIDSISLDFEGVDNVPDAWFGTKGTYSKVVGDDTDVTWEEVILENSDSIDDYRTEVENQIASDTSSELISWGTAKALGRITPGLGDAYTLADILTEDDDGCGQTLTGDNLVTDPCDPAQPPLLNQNIVVEFDVPRGETHEIVATHGLEFLDYGYFSNDYMWGHFKNVKEWGLTLPGEETEAELDESKTELKQREI